MITLEGKDKFSLWKPLCKKKKQQTPLHKNGQKQAKACILGGKLLWAAQNAAFFFFL